MEPASRPAAAVRSPSGDGTQDDAQVVAALDEYLAACETGCRPPREEFLSRHANIRAALQACLDGLDLVHGAAGELERRGASLVGATPDQGADESSVLSDAQPLGDFQLVREIGRGGMGVVYEARQLSLGRRVAVKVLPLAAALDSQRLCRFRQEAQAAAQLRHDHIVAIHAIGCERGVHFFAMDYVDGCSLVALVRELRDQVEPASADRSSAESAASSTLVQSLAGTATTGHSPPTHHSGRYFQTVARLGIQAADALEHAHQLGIVHRDIKPANLLIDPSGRLWVADFGLARLANDPGLTMTGDIVGTLRYMSPEQALGRSTTIDHRSDIYSLGVTLYELLTLVPAFPGADRQEVLQRLCSDEPTAPRRLNPALPPDLETIILKATSKSPEGRYAAAADLAADLSRFLEGRPITARRPSAWDRTLKWSRRHRAAVAAAFVTLTFAVTALAICLALVWTANRETARAYRAEAQQRALAQEALYAAHVNLAQQELDAGRPRSILELLEAHLPQGDEADPRTFEWHYLWNECQRGLQTVLRGHQGVVASLAFAPDGYRLASTSGDGTLRIWNLLNQDEAHALNGRSATHDVSWSGDGTLLATIDSQGVVTVWDVATARARAQLPGQPASQVCFAPHGRQLAVLGGAGEVYVLDAETLAILARDALPGDQASRLCYSQDGTRLAIGYASGTVALWNPSTGERQTVPLAPLFQVTAISWSADGQFVATGHHNGSVLLWTSDTLTRRYTWRFHDGNVVAVRFSPVANALATAGVDGIVALWDATNGQPLVAAKAHATPLYALAFSPDGGTLASAGTDGAIKIWEAFPSAPLRSLKVHSDAVWSVAVSADGQTVATAGRGEADVRLWNALTGESAGSLVGALAETRGVAYSPDGNLLAAGSADGGVRVWQAGTRDLWRTVHVADGQIRSVAIDSGGELLAAGTDGGSVALWNLNDERVLAIFETGTPVRAVAFVPGRRWLAALNKEGTLSVWDLSADRRIYSVPLPLVDGWSLAVSPDGRQLTCGGVNDALLIDAQTGAIVTQLKGHTRSIYAQAFSTDGRTLATAGMDRSIKLWDPENGHLRMTIKAGAGFVHALAFSPDGTRLFTGRHDGVLRFWRATPAPAATGDSEPWPAEPYVPPVPDDPRQCNNTAWELVNAPHEAYRDVARALEWARRAVELEPADGIHWQTLGVVQYRAGDLPAASESLARSCALRDGGDALDQLFLAMVAARQGDGATARRLVDQARQMIDVAPHTNDELRRFLAEAENTLSNTE